MGNKSSSSASGDWDDSASTIVADAVTKEHDLRIKGYSVTKGIGVGKSIISSSFRVAGHTWGIRYYPDGENTDCADWISLFLKLIPPDPTDDETVVRAKFKFSLLDQDGNPVIAHVKCTENAKSFSASSSWGFPKFIKRNGDFEGSNCLKDDSFRIRCEVTVLTEGIAKRSREKSMTNKKFVTVPPSKLNKELRGILWAGAVTDVTFDVGGEMFTAHRNVLAARSPVFKAELFGSMMEKTSSRVQIDDMETNVFRAMLHFIYTDSIPIMDMEDRITMAQHLLVAADRYDLKRLKLICEDKLCNHINNRNVAETLVLAEQHGCKGLKKAGFAFLMSHGNLKAAMATEGYDHLKHSCPALLDELISKIAP
ncbi:hypothetical protein EJB05_26598, partial [Eragrostis curvula]